MRPLAFIFLVLACVGFAFSHELNTLYAPGVGARAMGMGGAFVAASGDPSCIYWNPAGLAGIRKPMASLEGWRMWGRSQVEKSYYDPMREDYVYGPPSSADHSGLGLAAVVFPVTQATFALSTYIPYENSLWDGDSIVQGSAIRKGMESRVLRSSFAAATEVSFSHGSRLSLGLEVYADRLRYQRSSVASIFPWSVTKVQGNGYGFQSGILFQPTEEAAFGFAIQGQSLLNAEGSARYPSQHGDSVYVSSVTMAAKLPTLVKVGIRLTSKPLVFEWDLAMRTSEMGGRTIYYYDAGIPYATTPLQRAGMEIEVIRGLWLRGGAYYMYDGQQSSEPVFFTGGLGLERWGFHANGAIERTFGSKVHEQTTRATLGLTYALGK